MTKLQSASSSSSSPSASTSTISVFTFNILLILGIFVHHVLSSSYEVKDIMIIDDFGGVNSIFKMLESDVSNLQLTSNYVEPNLQSTGIVGGSRSIIYNIKTGNAGWGFTSTITQNSTEKFGHLNTMIPPFAVVEYILQYDGGDNAELNYTGLVGSTEGGGGVDLTKGGANCFRVDIMNTQPTSLQFDIYDTNGEICQCSSSIIEVSLDKSMIIEVDYSNITGGCNLQSVGAIEVILRSNTSLNFALRSILISKIHLLQTLTIDNYCNISTDFQYNQVFYGYPIVTVDTITLKIFSFSSISTLGGELDLIVKCNTAGTYGTNMYYLSFSDSSCLLYSNSGANCTLTLQYDGSSDGALNITGLTSVDGAQYGIDVTKGGMNSFMVIYEFTSDLSSAELEIRIFDLNANLSICKTQITNTNYIQTASFIKYSSCIGNADLSAVGAMQVVISILNNLHVSDSLITLFGLECIHSN